MKDLSQMPLGEGYVYFEGLSLAAHRAHRTVPEADEVWRAICAGLGVSVQRRLGADRFQYIFIRHDWEPSSRNGPKYMNHHYGQKDYFT